MCGERNLRRLSTARIGFIGGSGLYEMDGLEGAQPVDVDTPFGSPSDSIVVGEMSGERVAFLPRHGRGHRISPSNLPARANIYALKLLGVERVVSISAVGSLQEGIRPLDMVVPDQLIDRTRGRPITFFDEGVVVHTAFAEPYCPILGKAVWEAASSRGDGAQRRGLRRDRGSAVLDACGVRALSLVGRGDNRHDGAPGGKAGPRGGDVLRDPRSGHRL